LLLPAPPSLHDPLPILRRCAAIAAVVLCAASLPARPQGGSAAASPEAEVELTADRIVYDWEDRKLVLEGHVVATRGPAILRAARDRKSTRLNSSHQIIS